MDNNNNTTFNGSNSTNGTTFDWKPREPRTWQDFWIGLIAPTIYISLLIAGLWSFSTLYRKRQLSRQAKLEPWFPAHRQRDLYLSLLHLDPEEASSGGDDEKKLKKVPDSVLKAALLQRALEDVKRIVVLRTSKPALQTLLQRGSVGDELWQRFLRAEQEMEAEIKDVVTEVRGTTVHDAWRRHTNELQANAFSAGWGQVIFQSANEMNQNRILKERMAEMQAQLEKEKAWWETKRAGIQSEFMKEIGVEEAPVRQAPKKNGSSDDDAVLVDADTPGETQGGGKKKKGKK
ncbi:endoplasmic reticulum translocation complex chain SEC66 [Teratosphaeria destructans]|uniref:Endoplasmic reticulum translocation complex chain SEC66 n=1 Tax=Teratosphaeria destructans TaxID=418781 RepID=A0A9W7SN69_9PEZI|nr:endoplasmic reticulum translocation complex chain SEC66 [Teratosphaeria destructans]